LRRVKISILRPIAVEILLLIFHQQKIGAESGEEMLREVAMLLAQIITEILKQVQNDGGQGYYDEP